MTPFLKQVAVHYFGQPDIQETCFVFPNRRSLVFFKKYLGELVVGGKPLPVPPLFTINDFFYHVYHVEVTDRLRLLLELYACYKELNPHAEPLDEFIFWGDVLLKDFDDLDKYLVNARMLFQNVADFKGLQDSFEYLSDTQRSAIEHFLSHFRDRQGSLTVKEDGQDVKARFLKLWNLLYPLYESFRERLQEKGMAYEGMVYRDLASRLKEGASVKDILEPAFPQARRFVFVGLNALSECERLLLRRMRDARLAQFCWDFESEQIKDPANKASASLSRNIQDFPQAFPLDPEGLHTPQIKVVSVSSSVGQTKLAPQILAQTSGDPVQTAFILPDETLLLPLLNSIPPEYDSVNVTMGYPMTGSAIYTLISCLSQLQLKMRRKDGRWYFYHRTVHEIFSSGLFRSLLSPEEAAIVDQVKADAKYYIPPQDLQGGPVLEMLFQPVLTDPTEVSAANNHALERYLSQIVALVGRILTAGGDMLLELDFAKRCHTQLNMLQEIDLEVLPATHLRLLDRLLQGISVPFRGEPLEGLQIMGPLETRALDFRYLVIMSANEGVFPRRSANASFIPPELRKGFGLPTHEYQDAVWAYYFYRMIQRPEKVWLIYDSRTEGLKNGEESRYIKQLQYHFDLPVEKITAAAAMHPVGEPADIPKTPADVAAIQSAELSASALQSYLYCPAKFYYQQVQKLQTQEEVAESMDASMLGKVFHAVMQQLYSRAPVITPQLIHAFKANQDALRSLVRAQILEEMHSIEISGRNLVLENIILDYVCQTLSHDARLLQQSGSTGFRILGLEKRLTGVFEGFKMKGFLDRVDSYKPGEIRILDYKTGKVEDNELVIDEKNAAAVVEKLFGASNAGRPKIALQLFLYDWLLRQQPDYNGQTVVNAIYSTGRMYLGSLPEVKECPEFSAMVQDKLREMLREMTDVSIPFRRTQEKKSCEFCDFKVICGR